MESTLSFTVNYELTDNDVVITKDIDKRYKNKSRCTILAFVSLHICSLIQSVYLEYRNYYKYEIKPTYMKFTFTINNIDVDKLNKKILSKLNKLINRKVCLDVQMEGIRDNYLRIRITSVYNNNDIPDTKGVMMED